MKRKLLFIAICCGALCGLAVYEPISEAARPTRAASDEAPTSKVHDPKRAEAARAPRPGGDRADRSAKARNTGGTDPFGNPIQGEIVEEVTPAGDVISSAELVPGFGDARPVATTDEDGQPLPNGDAVEPLLPPEGTPPPGKERIDPLAHGYASMEAMESDVRAKFDVPDDHRVELWAEERDGKRGIAIDVIPPGEGGMQLQ